MDDTIRKAGPVSSPVEQADMIPFKTVPDKCAGTVERVSTGRKGREVSVPVQREQLIPAGRQYK
ncbi:MAG: hypothetical protein MSH32_09540 [Lachnospiraceae bacterium]|nr:hypothetical protein [Lachnospiraceae bacterium]